MCNHISKKSIAGNVEWHTETLQMDRYNNMVEINIYFVVS